MVEFGRIYININKYIYIILYINILYHFICLSTESFRFFWITRGCVPLTLIKPQERPTSSLSSDWSTWKGQGAPAVEPMIHQLSMGWVNIQATVLRPSFHIISSSQIQICDVYICNICSYAGLQWLQNDVPYLSALQLCYSQHVRPLVAARG